MTTAAITTTGNAMGWGRTLLWVGGTFIGAEIVGTIATHRTTLKPWQKGALRAALALVIAWLIRKKAPAISVGLGAYALGTGVRGVLEGAEADRYLSSADMQRRAQLQALGGTGTGTQTGQLGGANPGSGFYDGPENDTLGYYRSQGYATM